MPPDDPIIAARMRALAQLARPTTHELRGALSAMLIHLELLAGALDDADAPLRERCQRYLEVLREECARLQRVADGFVRLAALPAGPKDTDLGALVASVLDAARPVAVARRVRLQGGPYPTILRLLPEPETCRQHLLDAILDALAAAPPGSAVNIALETDGLRASVQVEAGASVEIALLDRGQ